MVDGKTDTMVMDNFDSQAFLKDYWQQKPLVVRKAFQSPFWIEPNDLAGLACEEEAEARIILQEQGKWQVECGPFEEECFANLPETAWTLLVQAVDHWVPEVQQILEHFNFLPRWRLDDIMVSYAPVGGTVSQHYDFFDVFLIQGEGKRQWQVGEVCGSRSEFLPDTPVRILKEFNAMLDVTLEPGDMLYIPAKYSHLGVSLEDSLTYSVGFRAPSVRDVVDGIATQALETLREDDRYRDCDISLQANTGEVPERAIDQVQAMLIAAMSDKALVADWFCRYVTEKKYPEHDALPELAENWKEQLQAGQHVYKNPASRFVYYGEQLFVDGDSAEVPTGLAQLLANTSAVDPLFLADFVNSSAVENLINSGALLLGYEE